MGLFDLKTLEDECRRIIEARGSVLRTEETGHHYLLNSGLHTDTFFQLARVFEDGPSRERLAKLLVGRMHEYGIHFRDIDVLAGPAFGALPIMYTMQHFLELEHTRVIFTERNAHGIQALGRGFSLAPDERVFIVDDVVTTFGTLRKTIAALHKYCADQQDGWNALPVGCAVLIDRSPEATNLLISAPTLAIVSGIRHPLVGYSLQDCPYCRRGVTLVKS